MKLEKISVKNFRTLEDLEVRFSGYYTAISGANNAGKTSLIRAIRSTFKDNSRDIYFYLQRGEITHADDATQWTKGEADIVFDYEIGISSSEDPGLFQFIEKFNDAKLDADRICCRIKVSHNQKDETHCVVWVQGRELATFASKEILQKLTSSSLAMMHDSAGQSYLMYGPRGRHLEELMFTPDELKQLSDELKKVQTKVKKISKAHKAALSELLGHLEDKYEVEFAIPEGMFTGTIPLAVNLRDKNVDVPLSDWGSGTRNRTQIMMSILHATRIRSKEDENKITPFLLIEEPESFLHPSAQAEFGRVLIDLANELRIQTIVTTHSPYMLCQREASSNVLLTRRTSYGKLKQTEIVDVQGDNWMAPFGVILGLDNAEFSAWKDALFSPKQCVLLVEGEIDKTYFEHINTLGLPGLTLPEAVDIVPYGGKDALKNTILLRFILQKFKRLLVTFDLDAQVELAKAMGQIGLVEGQDYLPLGTSQVGKQCVEGLVPDRILSKVHAERTDLVMQLTSADANARKSAKSQMKQAILAAFRADRDVTPEELKGFKKVFQALRKLGEPSAT